MTSAFQDPHKRKLLSVSLVLAAATIIVLEPFPKGVVLLALTGTHGIHAGDLPAVALLLIAGRLMI